jgi:hypothetical protein
MRVSALDEVDRTTLVENGCVLSVCNLCRIERLKEEWERCSVIFLCIFLDVVVPREEAVL